MNRKHALRIAGKRKKAKKVVSTWKIMKAAFDREDDAIKNLLAYHDRIRTCTPRLERA